MKTRIMKALTILTALVLLIFSAAMAEDASYTITTHFDDSNVAEIPSDAVNQVMFAYSETVDVDFNTTLTLNEDGTYTLYKEIVTAAMEQEDGTQGPNFHGEYEFTGTYTQDGDNVTLTVPTAAKYNCFYPTVLNYQSIEKQTQDWVDAADAPFVMNRFNKWYPAKNEGCVDQVVTLNADGSMNFAEVVFESAEEETEEETAFEPAGEELALPENGLIGAAAGDKTLILMKDGTFSFEYPAYGITEEGTWTWENYVLTVTPEGAEEGIVAAFDDNYNLALTYQCQKFTMITQDFVIENWGDALGTSGTYAAE